MASLASNDVRDPFGVRSTVDAGGHTYSIYSLPKLTEAGIANIDRLPFVVRIMLENLLRYVGTEFATADDVTTFANWDPEKTTPDIELAYLPARVVLQDFTGVPCVVDLAAMRSAVERMGGDVQKINPLVPVDLVIDHSVQVDRFGTTMAFSQNVDFEYERNRERYMLLRWAQKSFQNFRVVPPGTGIVHQVNLEYLASVVRPAQVDGEIARLPRFAGRHRLPHDDDQWSRRPRLGRRRHRGGGRAAWPAALLLMPEVVGFKLSGSLGPGATATDLVLRHRDAAQLRRGRPVRGVLRARLRDCHLPTGRRSPTWRPNTARRWASSRSTTKRCATCA